MEGEVAIFKPGDYLIKEFAEDSCMYVILEGEVKVLVTDEETGEKVEIATMSKNDFAGENALLFGHLRNADVLAISEVKAFVIPNKETLFAYIQKNPDFALSMIMILAKRVENLRDNYIRANSKLDFAQSILAANLRDFMPFK